MDHQWNITDDNEYTKHLKKLTENLPKPKNIVVISAHWLTNGTYVTIDKTPEQVYDFYGFPQKLYEIQYKPSGSPEIAEKIIEIGKEKDIHGSLKWGIDHAAWSVLYHIYPDADIQLLK